MSLWSLFLVFKPLGELALTKNGYCKDKNLSLSCFCLAFIFYIAIAIKLLLLLQCRRSRNPNILLSHSFIMKCNNRGFLNLDLNITITCAFILSYLYSNLTSHIIFPCMLSFQVRSCSRRLCNAHGLIGKMYIKHGSYDYFLQSGPVSPPLSVCFPAATETPWPVTISRLPVQNAFSSLKVQ